MKREEGNGQEDIIILSIETTCKSFQDFVTIHLEVYVDTGSLN